MKQLAITLTLGLFLAACGGNADKPADKPAEPAAATETPAANDLTANPDYVAGLELIAQQDCLTCHSETDKMVGPSYQEIANKYPNTEESIKTLAEKVVKGGAGNWGEVPMAPHPNITEEQAITMVKYVMTLKK